MTDALADFDWWGLLTDREFLRDPYAALVLLREAGPVHLDRRSGIYFVLGHRAFTRVAEAPEMGRDTRLWADGWARPGGAEHDPVGHRLYSDFTPQMINADPPDHGRMRGVFRPDFLPAAIAALAPMITAETRSLLDAMPAAGTVDMIEHLAAPLPLRVLRNMFEMPASMDAQIASWSATLIKLNDVMLSQEEKQEAQAALDAFKGFLRGHLDARRRCPHAGMIDSVITAADQGVLSEEETLTNLVAMLIAGHETTVTLIGNGLLLLLQHPAELARLRADRSLMRTAVEECLRFWPGGNLILRVARESLVVEGVEIRRGALVIGLVGAINRDPSRFERPDVVDIGRRPNPHITFGRGVHVCIGAPLARLEAQIAFDLLLDRFPRLALAGEPEWRLDRINARGLASLPVAVGA